MAGEGDALLLLSGSRRTDLRPEALTWVLFWFERFKAPQLVSALTVTPRENLMLVGASGVVSAYSYELWHSVLIVVYLKSE